LFTLRGYLDQYYESFTQYSVLIAKRGCGDHYMSSDAQHSVFCFPIATEV